MKFSINIDYPPEKMALNKKRMDERINFRYVDRVPVGFCVVPRYFAPILGLRYRDFFKDAETQFYWQLQFAKYHIENIPEDIVCHGPTITVYPYFDNVTNASAFGAQIVYPENETLHAIPVLETVEQMEAMQVPDPTAGLWGRALDWWSQFKEFAQETQLTFNGEEGHVEVGNLSIGGEGPHMVAVDMAGTHFYEWMLEYPEACHRFMDKITRGMIQAEKNFRRIDPRPRGAYGLAEDSSQIMSATLFKKFTVPYDIQLYDTFGAGLKNGRGMHMCGNSVHLHKALKEDLRISSFDIFGYLVEPEVAARNLSGVYLWGNVDPMLMLNGSCDEVKAACMHCLEAMAPGGGLLLGDGANVCPGTPLENLAVFTEAAEEYGLPSDHAHS